MKNALILIFVLLPILAFSQGGKMYPNGKGGEIYVPNGEISFADEVVEFKEGSPIKGIKKDHKDRRNPELSLGEPYKDKPHFSMGCEGELTLKFTDNVLVDIPGPDLFIFEVGEGIESVVVLISKDNSNWVYAGIGKGGTSTLDISDRVKPNEQFHYVKLIDLRDSCPGRYFDGAEIFAVAALGTVKSEVQVPEEIEDRKINFKRTVTVESDEISVSIWDNGKEDGDIISLNVNGEWVLKDFEVKSESDKINVKIKKGENFIVLHAENLGRIEPNTAALKIDDGQMEKTIILNSNMGESEGIKIVR